MCARPPLRYLTLVQLFLTRRNRVFSNFLAAHFAMPKVASLVSLFRLLFFSFSFLFRRPITDVYSPVCLCNTRNRPGKLRHVARAGEKFTRLDKPRLNSDLHRENALSLPALSLLTIQSVTHMAKHKRLFDIKFQR